MYRRHLVGRVSGLVLKMAEPLESQGKVSHLWSCTTLGDGLQYVDADVASGIETLDLDEEATLLAQLKDL